MSNQKNKLRRGKNVKVLIYIGVIFFLLLLVFGIVAAYIIIDYEYVTGKTVKFGIEPLKDFFDYLSAPQLKAPISFSNIILILETQDNI